MWRVGQIDGNLEKLTEVEPFIFCMISETCVSKVGIQRNDITVVVYEKCHPQLFKNINGIEVTFLVLKKWTLYHELSVKKEWNVAI